MITYAITDRTLDAQGDLLVQVSTLLRLGVSWVQIREKDLCDRALYDSLKAIAPEAGRFGVKVLLNARPDIAVLGGCDGVHLPSSGLATAAVRKHFERPFLVVRSCHCVEEVLKAADEGADAVTLGPVFETPSKAPYGPPLGLEAFRLACSKSPIPVIGLGGIDICRVSSVMEAGAAGVAAIRMFAGLRPAPQGEAGLSDFLLNQGGTD